MKIFDWFRLGKGKDSYDEEQKPEDGERSEDEEHSDEDNDPTNYPLW
jgi:hypothetical protein